MVKIQISTN